MIKKAILKFRGMTKKEFVAFVVLLFCIIGTIVLNCSSLAWGTYMSEINGVRCSYSINGDIFHYKETQDGDEYVGIGLYKSRRSSDGGTVVTFMNINNNGSGSISVRRDNAFSFTYSPYGNEEYQFFNGWAFCRQLIYVVGMVACIIYLIPWIFGRNSTDETTIKSDEN